MSLGQATDPDWLDEVVEHITGVAYEPAHPYAGTQAEWRDAYRDQGANPLVLVCDQLSELIQHIRGLRNYGEGLTGHMEHYMGAGALHQGNLDARPGVRLFHVVPSGKAHALDIEAGKRVPRPDAWSTAARMAAVRAQSNLLGGGLGR